MKRVTVLFLVLLTWPGTSQSGKLTAVISPTGKEVLEPECREILADMLGALKLSVLPKDADAVTGDVVLEVSFGGKTACRLTAFVTPTGKKLASSEKTGKSSRATCRDAAVALKERLREPLAKLQVEGLPHVLVLRWSGKLKSDPARLVGSWFKRQGIKAKPTAQSGNSCSFLFTSKVVEKDFGSSVKSFLLEHYKVEREPPDSLPRARRSFMYLLKDK